MLHNVNSDIYRKQQVDNNSEEVDRNAAVRKNTGINNTHTLRQRQLTEIYFRPNNLKTKINAVHYFKIHFLASQKMQSSIKKNQPVNTLQGKSQPLFILKLQRNA